MLSILLAVPSCFNSFWHGIIPTSYFIFNDFYTCVLYEAKGRGDSIDVTRSYPSKHIIFASSVCHCQADGVIIRPVPFVSNEVDRM